MNYKIAFDLMKEAFLNQERTKNFIHAYAETDDDQLKGFSDNCDEDIFMLNPHPHRPTMSEIFYSYVVSEHIGFKYFDDLVDYFGFDIDTHDYMEKLKGIRNYADNIDPSTCSTEDFLLKMDVDEFFSKSFDDRNKDNKENQDLVNFFTDEYIEKY